MDPPRTRSKIYIGNLPESVRKHELLMEFDKFGEVLFLFVNKGFAHLTYVDSRSAQDAIRLMDGVPFSGNRLRVEMSQDSRKTQDAAHGRASESFHSSNRRGASPPMMSEPRRRGAPINDYSRGRSDNETHSRNTQVNHRRSWERDEDFPSRRQRVRSPPRYRSRSPNPRSVQSSHTRASSSRTHNYHPNEARHSEGRRIGHGDHQGMKRRRRRRSSGGSSQLEEDSFHHRSRDFKREECMSNYDSRNHHPRERNSDRLGNMDCVRGGSRHYPRDRMDYRDEDRRTRDSGYDRGSPSPVRRFARGR